MKETLGLYSEMLLDLAEKNFCRRRMSADAKLTAHYTCAGEDFELCRNRLMYVGRSVNGWNDDLCWSVHQKFDAVSANLKAEEIVNYWERNNLEWVKTALPGKKTKRESYPFWHLAKRIVLALDSDATNDSWTKRIAWANLYKISPMHGGNPWDSLCKAQLPYAKKILKAEIVRFRPTHIIFVTGDEWFSDFVETIDEVAANLTFKSLVVSRPEVRNKELNIYRENAINKTFNIEI